MNTEAFHAAQRAGESTWHGAVRVAEAVAQHPAAQVSTGIGLSIVAVLQSAQEIVGTVIALVTSLTGLVLAITGLRSAWKKRRKP